MQLISRKRTRYILKIWLNKNVSNFAVYYQIYLIQQIWSIDLTIY